MLSRFVKRHSGFTRRFAVVIPEMVLVTMVMDVVPVTCTDIRATILSMSSISLDNYYYLLLRPREGWSMAKDATLSRRVVMTTRSCCIRTNGKYKAQPSLGCLTQAHK